MKGYNADPPSLFEQKRSDGEGFFYLLQLLIHGDPQGLKGLGRRMDARGMITLRDGARDYLRQGAGRLDLAVLPFSADGRGNAARPPLFPVASYYLFYFLE